MDYIDYALNQYLDAQAEGEKICDEMEELGLDWKDEEAVENYRIDREEYLRSIHEDCEKV